MDYTLILSISKSCNYFWIDFFIPQGTLFGFEIIGTALKILFFIIQIMGLFQLIFSAFSAGTGARG